VFPAPFQYCHAGLPGEVLGQLLLWLSSQYSMKAQALVKLLHCVWLKMNCTQAQFVKLPQTVGV
jgi:hypothetical protein